MAQYKAVIKCFVDNTLRNEGDIFEYEGPQNDCLELVDVSDESSDDEPGKPRRRVRKPE